MMSYLVWPDQLILGLCEGRAYYCLHDVKCYSEMATKKIKKHVAEDELAGAAEPGTALRESPLVSRLAPRSCDEHLDSEERELVEARLVRLPDKSLPDSFRRMPAPRVSLMEAVSAVTSERDES